MSVLGVVKAEASDMSTDWESLTEEEPKGYENL
jgi:hypothetical protein